MIRKNEVNWSSNIVIYICIEYSLESYQLDLIFTNPQHHQGSIYTVSYNCNDSLLATASNDKIIKIHENKFGLFGHSSSIDECTDFYQIDKGEHILEVVISSPFLPGSFFVTINAAEDSGKSLCCIENAISFEITRKGFKDRSDYLWTESCAPCFIQSSWKIE